MNTEKRTYSVEERTRYVEQWKQSGLLKSEFARNHNISYTTFIHWISGRKFKANRKELVSITTPQLKPEPPAFVSIQVTDQVSNTTNKPVMELILAGGNRLNFYQAVSADYIRSLLK